LNPNQRSAGQASRTRPPEITAWTSEIGARARAATWKTQPPVATSMPIVHQRERKRALVDSHGCEKRTSGAATAPLCLHRKPMLPMSAQSSAKRIPSSIMEWVV
jgi:hypothetical protein